MNIDQAALVLAEQVVGLVRDNKVAKAKALFNRVYPRIRGHLGNDTTLGWRDEFFHELDQYLNDPQFARMNEILGAFVEVSYDMRFPQWS